MMARRAVSGPWGARRTVALAIFLVIQGVAALFFVGDALRDLTSEPLGLHSIVESLVAAVLVIGLFLVGWLLRITLDQMEAQERALDTARGDFLKVVEAQFEA